jgi:flagellar protein FlaJ
MIRISKLAFAVFGNYVRKNEKSYLSLKLELIQARIGLQWDIYGSTVLLISSIISVVVLLSAAIIIPYWRFLYLNYLKIVLYTGVDLKNFGEPIFITGVIILISLIAGGLSYVVLMLLPGFLASNRKSKIDLTLPHAVFYMHALSKGGLNLILIFKSLSEHTEV